MEKKNEWRVDSETKMGVSWGGASGGYKESHHPSFCSTNRDRWTSGASVVGCLGCLCAALDSSQELKGLGARFPQVGLTQIRLASGAAYHRDSFREIFFPGHR